MEKRVVLFMVLSAAVMFGYVAFQATFGTKKPPAPVAKKQDDAKKKGEKQAPTKPATSPEEQPSENEKPDELAPDVQATRASQKWVTLGSVDPNSPYRMLVTFNSRGAAIERIELASPRYRDLDDRSGYLGHLALKVAPGRKGAQVNVVGAGTPAATAVEQSDKQLVGLQPGDIIDAVDGEPVNGPLNLETYLADKTRPGQEIKLSVRRGSGSPLTFLARLGRRPLEVIRPEPEGGEGPDPVLKLHPPSFRMTLVGARQVRVAGETAEDDPLRTAHWEVREVGNGKAPSVEFVYRLDEAQAKQLELPGPVEVVRRYTLASVGNKEEQEDPSAKAYHITCDLEIHNLTDEGMELAYRMDGPNGLPLEGWWYSTKISPNWSGAGARDIVWRRAERTRSFRSTGQIYKYATKNPTNPRETLLGGEETTQLDYIGVDAQYFSAVLIPDPEGKADKSQFRTAVSFPVSDVTKIPKVEAKRTDVTFQVTSDLKPIPAGGVYKQSMQIFAGPKVPELLAHYTPRGMDDIIEYGWFSAVAIPLSKLLHFLKHNLLFNYGLAIIALTVIVRGCMFPFSRRAAKNAQIMQELSPELKKIAEKYKNDLQKRSEAQSELFKKYNYHPLSGCLPMFLQLPIFLGLYRSLAVDIELRQAPLIPGIQWASNLAGPDMLWRWKDYLPNFLAGEASGWLGPYLNILPIISVVFLIIHQKLFTPPATDEQTKMTHDMMKYMTVFMGVLFFKVPAGLCIYFITSSLWSICERVMLPHPQKPQAGAAIAATEKKPSPFAPKPTTNGTTAEERRARRQKHKPKKK